MNIHGKISLIKHNLKRLKEQDCHIYDDDSESIKRQKDMLFGKIMAYEEILDILNK